jgi:hypothetical protein
MLNINMVIGQCPSGGILKHLVAKSTVDFSDDYRIEFSKIIDKEKRA